MLGTTRSARMVGVKSPTRQKAAGKTTAPSTSQGSRTTPVSGPHAPPSPASTSLLLPSVSSFRNAAKSRLITLTPSERDLAGVDMVAAVSLTTLPSVQEDGGASGRAERRAAREAAAAAAHDTGTAAVMPRSEEVTQYVLYDGLPQVGPTARRVRQRQAEAYYQFQRRIHDRAEAAHALVVSANPLTLSVMASQLRMYRWRVTEAQTLTEATAALQDFVMETSKRGYRVRRRAPPPPPQSRYANGRGRAVLRRRGQRELQRLSGLKTTTGAAAPAAYASSALSSPRSAADLHAAAAGDSDDDDSESSTSRSDSGHTVDDDLESAMPPPPPDALPRLVIVDAFTHEDLGDIARHVRFVDREHRLEMLLVLLLPGDIAATAASMQGAGCVVAPPCQMSIEEAYAAGYDLVLAHTMDHLLVDFFTTAFVSSAGRWRNDVRSKAAVGNYMSLRNVLLGGLDTAALQRLVWDDRVDDAGVLELLGAQAITAQRSSLRVEEAAELQEAVSASAAMSEAESRRAGTRSRGSSADSTATTNPGHDRDESVYVTGVPRLRSRPVSVAHFGVRLPASHVSAQEPLTNFTSRNDVFAGVMTTAQGSDTTTQGGGNGQRRSRRAGEDGDEEPSYQQRLLQAALEKELGRLLVENEGKQAALNSLQEEVERLHRTVAVLKRYHSLSAPASEQQAGGGASGPERPDSGSMMHLSKQQQIFILKERLETANERVATLLREGRASVAGVTPRAGGGGHQVRRGGSMQRRAVAGGGAVGGPSTSPTRADSYDDTTPKQYAALLATMAAQEATSMATHDADANFSEAQLAQHRSKLTAALEDPSAQGAETLRQRKERETAEQVIHSLEQELQEMRSSLDKSPMKSPGKGGKHADVLQARMAARLQSALDVLETQKVRIRHLEELRQMDQLLLKTTLGPEENKERSKKRRVGGGGGGPGGGANARAAGSDDDSGSLPSDSDDGDGGRGAGRGRRPQRHPSNGRGTGRRYDRDRSRSPLGRTSKGGAHATPDARPGTNTPRGYGDEDAEEAAARRTEAAVLDAVTTLQREHRRELASLVESCKTQLSRLALKLQKPSTAAYAELMQEELSRAKRNQRGALMRLRFALTGLTHDQYDEARVRPVSPLEADASKLAALTEVVSNSESLVRESSVGGTSFDDAGVVPPGAVTDANVRFTVASVAREYAAYGLQVAYSTNELQRVRKTARPPPPQLPPSPSPGPGDSPTTLSALPAVYTPSAAGADPVAEPEELLAAHETAKARVQESLTRCEPMRVYLEAVQAELAAEQQLRPWCDVDSEQLFEGFPGGAAALSFPVARAAGGSVKATAAPPRLLPRTTSSVSAGLVPSTLHVSRAASFPAGEAHTPATAVAATAAAAAADAGGQDLDAMCRSASSGSGDAPVLLLADVDASMRDVADVYATLLRSLVSPIGASNTAAVVGDAVAVGVGRRRGGAEPQTLPSSQSPAHKRATSASAGKRSLAAKAPGRGVGRGSNPIRESTPPPPTLEEVMTGLPVSATEVARYQGQLRRLYTHPGACSAAQQRLYELLLRAYQQHRIHPTHMAVVEVTVGVSAPNRRSTGRRRSSSSTSVSATAASAASGEPDGLLPLFAVVLAQHRELLALLDFIVPSATPALRRLAKDLKRVQRLLDREEAAPNKDAPTTAPAFLSAVDAALLGCIVDELRWRQLHRAPPPHKASVGEGSSSASSPSTSMPALAGEHPEMVRAMLQARQGMGGGSDTAAGAAPHGGPAQQRETEHYVAFCAAREKAAGRVRGDAGDSQSSTPPDADDLFIAPDTASLYSAAAVANRVTPDSSVLLSDGPGAGAGRSVAHELAALLSKRHPRGADADDDSAAALLEELYRSEDDDLGPGVGGDANSEAMRNLRRELEYLQAVKRQRLEELMVRFEMQKGRRGNSATRPASKSATHGDSRQPLPTVDPGRLGFEVKSGSPAWYGMEAAKRVHDILRRRARPDQIIVGGGPHGGGVGIELSRRTAQPGAAAAAAGAGKGGSAPGAQSGTPARNLADEGFTTSPMEEALDMAGRPYASRKRSGRGGPGASPTTASSWRLPPLRSVGSSRVPPSPQRGTQMQSTAHWADSIVTSELYGGADTSDNAAYALHPENDPLGYVSPRDQLSLSAYGHMSAAGAYGIGVPGYSTYTTSNMLVSQVLAYRDALTRAGSRAGPLSATSYADGRPYSLPLSSPVPHGVGATARERVDANGNRPPSPLPLPDVTTWVYGVPDTHASALVHHQEYVSPQQPQDTVLFLPRQPHSALAEVEERQRTRGIGGRPPPLPRGRGFTAGASAAHAASGVPYSTPAALAAQRLQAMLAISIGDPSVSSAAAAAAGRVALPSALTRDHSASGDTPAGSAAPPNARGSGAAPRGRDAGRDSDASLPQETNPFGNTLTPHKE